VGDGNRREEKRQKEGGMERAQGGRKG